MALESRCGQDRKNDSCVHECLCLDLTLGLDSRVDPCSCKQIWDPTGLVICVFVCVWISI